MRVPQWPTTGACGDAHGRMSILTPRPQELLNLWDDVALQWAREVSEHPTVVEKVARYVAIHRELKNEPRGPR
jgi:hypothetical protein